jgi:hypothetical protein
MRKTQGSGARPADRIVLRAGRKPGRRVPQRPKRVPFVHPARSARSRPATPRSGVTMDYQMGFTSGPSN